MSSDRTTLEDGIKLKHCDKDTFYVPNGASRETFRSKADANDTSVLEDSSDRTALEDRIKLPMSSDDGFCFQLPSSALEDFIKWKGASRETFQSKADANDTSVLEDSSNCTTLEDGIKLKHCDKDTFYVPNGASRETFRSKADANDTSVLEDSSCPPPHYRHLYKSTNICSQRTRLYDAFRAPTNKSSHLRKGTKKQKQEQLVKVNENKEAAKNFPVKDLQKHYVVFDGSATQQTLIVKNKPQYKKLVVHNIEKLQVLNSNEGLIFRPNIHKPPVFILVPRREVIKDQKINSLITALDELYDRTKITNTRGKGRFVAFETENSKYVTCGTQPNRAKSGVSTKALEELTETNWQRIFKFVQRCEAHLAAWMDSDVLTQHKHAAEIGKFATMPGPQDKKTSIFGALALGKNVFLNSHIDDDYFYSLTTTQCKPGLDGTHKLDDDILNYFTFPTHGVAVPLRPGDVLIFNPQVYHSVSSRCSNKKELYCISLYLKTAVVGKNSNLIQLTTLEQKIADSILRVSK